MSAEDIHLCLYAFFQPVLQRGGCLSFQRKRNTPGSEDIIGRVKEGTDTSDSQIIHRLIDDLLQHDGSQAASSARDASRRNSSIPWQPIRVATIAM